MSKKVPSNQVQTGGITDFTLLTKYPYGYRSREDITNLPPGVLIRGSQNVLTNTAGRVSITQGYTLDGQASAVIAPILSSFDWQTHFGPIRHLRAGFLTAAGNDGKLQYRFVDSTGTVTWVDLLTALTSTVFNFTDYWDATQLQAYLLFVNGASGIWEWSGGSTTFASATATTITKQGTTTWAEEGFYVAGTRQVTIGGIVYTYTGGETTTTLTGVTPDPTLGGHAVGAEIHQTPRFTANSAMPGLPATLKNQLIANLRNQIYIAALDNNSVYISKVNNYKDYTFTAPIRLVGEGALVTLDGPPTALIPQEEFMYISAKPNDWYQTQFSLSADNAAEQLSIARLKTAPLQATQSQGLTSNMGNSVIFISNEPILQSLGRVQNVVLTPQLTDISYQVVDDFNGYDFTDGQVFYHKKFIYVAVPKEGVIRVYNMTDPSNQYWEAPLTIPFSRFSVIDGELYGHSYLVSESYKMFIGYNFNGHPIDARAVFAYNHFGSRSKFKRFNEFYTEGYISANGTLNLELTFEIDGCAQVRSYEMVGNDKQFVCVPTNLNSLGKYPFGKQPLGSNIIAQSDLPPKFRWIKTFTPLDFYEVQVAYRSVAVDFHWEILACGPTILEGSSLNVTIKD